MSPDHEIEQEAVARALARMTDWGDHFTEDAAREDVEATIAASGLVEQLVEAREELADAEQRHLATLALCDRLAERLRSFMPVYPGSGWWEQDARVLADYEAHRAKTRLAL